MSLHPETQLQLRTLRRGSPGLRREAARWLAGQTHPDVLTALCEAARQDPLPEVRRELVRVLGSTGQRRAMFALIEVFQSDADPWVRAEAVTQLERLGFPEGREEVWTALRDPSVPLRFAAVEALGEAAGPEGQTHVLAALEFPPLRPHAVRWLAEHGNEEGIRALYRALARHGHEDLAFARAAAERLPDLVRRHPLPELAETLEVLCRRAATEDQPQPFREALPHVQRALGQDLPTPATRQSLNATSRPIPANEDGQEAANALPAVPSPEEALEIALQELGTRHRLWGGIGILLGLVIIPLLAVTLLRGESESPAKIVIDLITLVGTQGSLLLTCDSYITRPASLRLVRNRLELRHHWGLLRFTRRFTLHPHTRAVYHEKRRSAPISLLNHHGRAIHIHTGIPKVEKLRLADRINKYLDAVHQASSGDGEPATHTALPQSEELEATPATNANVSRR